jgi:predicted amidohydrolase
LFFDAGTTKPKTFKWRGVRIGLGVCYDYMFPEFWRILALQKADLFCNTANFVFNYGFKMMQARSIENGVFSITVNRTGKERGQKFSGGSEIVDNKGNIFKKSGAKEEIFVFELDLLKSRNKKWNKYNDLIKDRRPRMYKLR